MGNQKYKIQRKMQHWLRKTKTKNGICVAHHNTQINTKNINRTSAVLQKTGGKEEPNIVFMWNL